MGKRGSASIVLGWLLIGVAAACGGAAAGGKNAADNPATTPGSAAPSNTTDWAVKAASENASAAKASASSEHAPAVPEWTSTSGFDVKAWMAARHVTGQIPAEATCEAAQVGAPPADAISCDVRLEVQVGRSIVQNSPDEPPTVVPPTVQFRRQIHVVSGGALRKVFDIPIEAGPFNPVTKDPDANAYARLQVELDSTGTKLSVTDDPNFSCDHARAKEKELGADRDTAEIAGMLKKAVDPVCAARGDYAWKAGSFQKLPSKKNKK